MRILLTLLFFSSGMAAQETVAPTGEPVGPVRGTNVQGYNIVNSVETGYRFSTVGGSRDQYRSVVNFGNGIRLLGSSLTVNSRTGHGHYFDELVLTTQGLGNDPYESATLRVQKNRAYRYDLLWRSNDYFNPGFTIANRLHRLDLNHRWQDHDLLLFPQSKIRIRAGYSRTAQNGAALTTVPFIDPTASVFPVFADVKRQWNEYRIGGELDFQHFRLTVVRRWEFYKEDSPLSLASPEAGNDPADPTILSSFHRAEPYHGSTPGWLVNAFFTQKHFAVNGRFTESSGNRGFIQAESAAGIDSFGGANQRQITVIGNAQRPVLTGDLSMTLLASDRISFVNTTSFHNTRINGNAAYAEFDSGSAAGTALYFQFLGIRRIENASDARYRLTKKLDLYGGYRYSAREIRSIQSATDPTTPFSNELNTASDHLHAGVAGFNWNPVQPVRIRFEGEIGRSDHPFTPTAEANYHALNAMFEYRLKPFQLRAGYKQNYNNNSVVITSYSSRARSTYVETSYSPKNNVSLDASYSHLHLDTLGGIAFFAGTGRPRYITGFSSDYVSNVHAANLGVRFSLRGRAEFYSGYSITHDAGDGRSSPQTSAGAVSALLSSVQTFPLSYQSPLARVSLRLKERLRWNVGYQYYAYREEFGLFGLKQNFRAHTGFTSLTWTF